MNRNDREPQVIKLLREYIEENQDKINNLNDKNFEAIREDLYGISCRYFPGAGLVVEDKFMQLLFEMDSDFLKKLTRIPRSTFYDMDWLTGIKIPDNIKTIGYGAFQGCSNLKNIIIPADSIIDIEAQAFQNCISLTNITIPSNINTIEDSTFRGCKELNNITIPNSVTNIGDFAFYECSKLTSITIPNSVKSIGDYAFFECTRLTITTDNDYVEKYCKEYHIKYKRV